MSLFITAATSTSSQASRGVSLEPKMTRVKRVDIAKTRAGLAYCLIVLIVELQASVVGAGFSLQCRSTHTHSSQYASRRISCFAYTSSIERPLAQKNTMYATRSSVVVKSSPTPSSEATPPQSNNSIQSTPIPELYSVDIRYNRRSPLTYDAESGRYLDVSMLEVPLNDNDTDALSTNSGDTLVQKWTQFLHSAFVPEGVTPSYYRFMRWRILQRFINANVHVIGTQSLLMGLRGMTRSGSVGEAASFAAKEGAALGAAAATNWVLKDTLGKIVRMVWASKMGRKFDPDAKRWRFRSALIYALGNGLEVSTYLHPQYFLLLAMLANSCKQMSMLTSSATRNALYNSFKRVGTTSSTVSTSNNASGSSAIVRRGGNGGIENIGDITAKGEAQIAVVDLLGIASGICLSSKCFRTAASTHFIFIKSLSLCTFV